MAGEPQHAAAKAPVARAARYNHAIELMLAHLGADRCVTPRVFLRRKLLVYRVAIVWRAAHHVERLGLVEARLELIPGERLRAGGGHALLSPCSCRLSVVRRLSRPRPWQSTRRRSARRSVSFRARGRRH